MIAMRIWRKCKCKQNTYRCDSLATYLLTCSHSPNFEEESVDRSGGMASSGIFIGARNQSLFSTSQSTNHESIFPTHRKGLENELSDNLPIYDSEEDDMVAYAIQESLDQSQAQVHQPESHSKNSASDVPKNLEQSSRSPRDKVNQEYAVHNRLETALLIANAGPGRVQSSPSGSSKDRSLFGQPTLLSSVKKSLSSNEGHSRQSEDFNPGSFPRENNNQGLPVSGDPVSPSIGRMVSLPLVASTSASPRADQGSSVFGKPGLLTPIASTSNHIEKPASSLNENLEQTRLPPGPHLNTTFVVSTVPNTEFKDDLMPISESDDDMEEVPVEVPLISRSASPETDHISTHDANSPFRKSRGGDGYPESPKEVTKFPFTENEEVFLSPSARSPALHDAESGPPTPHLSEDEWDAAKEIDANQEEGEFARFMSHVKGRNMEEVRREIDAEINDLNQQRKNAMRDSDDITQQMIAQIMVFRLFLLQRIF